MRITTPAPASLSFKEDFEKLFGVPASETGPYIDEEMFLMQPLEVPARAGDA